MRSKITKNLSPPPIKLDPPRKIRTFSWRTYNIFLDLRFGYFILVPPGYQTFSWRNICGDYAVYSRVADFLYFCSTFFAEEKWKKEQVCIMYSSKMRTARLLSTSRNILGGCLPREVVGVPGGGSLFRDGGCFWHGVSAGGVYPSMQWGRHPP